MLILWVAPRLNPRLEPEHYIQALAPAEAEKNEGLVRDPLGVATMPTQYYTRARTSAPRRPDPRVPTSPARRNAAARSETQASNTS